MKKMYLNDLMLEKKLDIISGKLNLVVAPCGAGKTTWFFDTLSSNYKEKKRIWYLVDTNMLEESMIKEYEEEGILQIYRPEIKDELDPSYLFKYNAPDKITVMSYAKFGLIMKTRSDILQYIDLIVCDEVHNLINYTNIKGDKIEKLADIGTEAQDVHNATRHISNPGRALYMLPQIAEQCDVVMMTATPRKVVEHEFIKDYLYDVLGDFKYRLKTYKNEVESSFVNIKNIYKRFKNIVKIKATGHKILVYSQSITNCMEIKGEFEKLGYNVEALWSTNNDKKKMTPEQLQLRQYLIENKKYPENLDVLIINGAYETGWNLEDKDVEIADRRVNIVICNTSCKDTITQARGRVRHDILVLYSRKVEKNAIDKTVIEIEPQWIDVRLTKVDKDQLVKGMDIRSSENRVIGWTTFKKILIKSGYKVEDSPNKITVNGKRLTYSIISIA